MNTELGASSRTKTCRKTGEVRSSQSLGIQTRETLVICLVLPWSKRNAMETRGTPQTSLLCWKVVLHPFCQGRKQLLMAPDQHNQAEPKQGRCYVTGNGGTSPTQTLFTYLDMFLLVPVGYCINAVKTWSQEHVEMATFSSVDPQAFIQNNGSFRNWPATTVLDNAMHSLMDLKQSISNTYIQIQAYSAFVTKMRSIFPLKYSPLSIPDPHNKYQWKATQHRCLTLVSTSSLVTCCLCSMHSSYSLNHEHL